jgi:hypothetical protein
MVHPLTLTAGARDEQEEKVSITRRRMKRCSILIIVFECAENMQKRWKSIDSAGAHLGWKYSHGGLFAPEGIFIFEMLW